jgi:hypothetical protein
MNAPISPKAIRSSSQRPWPIPVVIAGLFVLMISFGLAQTAQAGGGVVTNCTNDIELTTKLAGGGNITFNCGGPKTIVFTTQKIITQPTTIDGGGVITFSSGGLTRTFFVSTSGQLAVSNLVFYNNRVVDDYGGAIRSFGPLTVTNSRFISNSAISGGAIQIDGGNVYITGSQFYRNSVASWGGAIDNDSAPLLRIVNTGFYSNTGGSGSGAIDADSGGATDISGSTFEHNIGSTDDGGAIWSDSQLTITNSLFQYNHSAFYGGAIQTFLGSAFIADSQFYSNTTVKSGGALDNEGASILRIVNSGFHYNTAGNSGGALDSDSSGVVDFSGSQLDHNTALAHTGGAIWENSQFTMTNSTMAYNTAYIEAGALENFSTAKLIDVQVYSNTVNGPAGGGYTGGGLENDGGQLTLIRTTIRNNTAPDGGGGLSNDTNYVAGVVTITESLIEGNQTGGNGGGLNFDSGSLTLINSTVARNSAQLSGGGLFMTNTIVQPAQITNSTFYSNSAASSGNFGGKVQIINTIAALGSPDNCVNAGDVTSLGHNLEFGNSCGLTATGDLTNTNPQLMVWPSLGNLTWGYLPVAGSLAIDHGDDTVCPPIDQRGFTRWYGAHCDIGAVEYYPLAHLYLPLTLKNS